MTGGSRMTTGGEPGRKRTEILTFARMTRGDTGTVPVSHPRVTSRVEIRTEEGGGDGGDDFAQRLSLLPKFGIEKGGFR